MTDQHNQFSRNLIKGRIAEMIFSQMFREAGKYTVLEFGYERIIPELVQSGFGRNSGIVETLRTAPDFAVINRDARKVRLIEVKYRRVMNNLDALKIAHRMHDMWNPSWLFVCTLDGFYFDRVDRVIDKNGNMDELSVEMILGDLQTKYLQLLRDFEVDK